jgi:glyoxylase-like metal-dependent hydrolase (beta-lactamase superfamily II)
MANLPPYPVPEMSGDERVLVFRRSLDIKGEFEGLEVDAYVVLTDRYVVMLDTMLCPADAEAIMRQVGDAANGKTLLCVNSHADWDHAWGNAYFQGATTIIGHEQCRARLLSVEAAEELRVFQKLDPLFRDVELVAPSLTFSERLTLFGGDLTIELLATPGHHLDEISAWIPELSLLLAFDAVESPFPSVDGAASVPQMFRSLERLLALEPHRVLCSHGNTSSPALIEQNLAYFREIELRSRAYLDNYSPSRTEFEQVSRAISYSFEEAIAGVTGPIDRTYYSQAHEDNCAAVLRWLSAMKQAISS